MTKPQDRPNEALLFVPIAELHPSPLNPRTHFPEMQLRELGSSLKEGQLTPLLVRLRPKGKGYEIAAGHRRLKAAQLFGLSHLLCRVADLDDQAFVRAMTTEQTQHEAFTPLEEAQAYASLQRVGKMSVEEIASAVKKERRYIADRLRLLNLTNDAKKLLETDEIRVEHAVILARLSPVAQAAAIAEGLFEREGFFGINAEQGRKPRSPRELQAWIDNRIRLEWDATTADLFPETAKKLEAAAAEEAAVVHITYEHALAPSAKSDKQRTYGPRSWKPTKTKPCEHQQLGLVVAGPQRGDSFYVCLAKKTCRTHWAKEIKDAESVKKAASNGDKSAASQAEQKREEAQKREEEARALWGAAAGDIALVVVAKLKKAKVGPTGLGRELLRETRGGTLTAKAIKSLGKPKTEGDLLRLLLAEKLLGGIYNDWGAVQYLPSACKLLGIDPKPILATAAKLRAAAQEKAAR